MTPMEGQPSGKRSVLADQERVRMIERRFVVVQDCAEGGVESINSHLKACVVQIAPKQTDSRPRMQILTCALRECILGRK